MLSDPLRICSSIVGKRSKGSRRVHSWTGQAQGGNMRAKTALYASVAIVLLAAGYPASMNAQQTGGQQTGAAIQIDADDIGGVVTSRFGPEAGVWVIAETTELGTRFARMVVTDEVGRYMIPDLPKAKYRVWVR